MNATATATVFAVKTAMVAAKRSKDAPAMTPTAEQFDAYRAMFRHLNRELFGASLPEPLLNFSRGPQRAIAFFAPRRWQHDGAQKVAHEISLNPRHLRDGSAIDTAISFAHEMVHLWQCEYGTPSGSFHNIEWSTKMLAIGLQPINAKTGRPAMSAHSMTPGQVIAGGAFERAFATMPADALLPWSCVEARATAPKRSPKDGGEGEGDDDGEGGEPTAPKSKNKTKYTCASCKANVWGRPGLVIACASGHAPALFEAVG